MSASGTFSGSPADLEDGFIHLSSADQVKGTAAKHFRGESDLTLLAVDPERLGDALKWEPSRGGALFPHLYGLLTRDMVAWAKPVRLGKDGVHVFPDLDP